MITSTEPIGLRERKRAETRQQLERAAVELVLREGIERTTVDAICESIPVSPRTFFNYFESKEDAILGVRDIELDEATIAAHLETYREADLIESVTGLLFSIIEPTVPTAAMREARVELVKRYPQLLGRQVAQFTRMGAKLVAAIAAIVAHDPAFAASTAAERSTFAEIILPLCGGAVRIAVKEWIADGATQTPEHLQNRASTLIREALEKLK